MTKIRSQIFWFLDCVALAAIIVFAVYGAICFLENIAQGGEITMCRDSPGRGNWVYRVIDGHRCWFEAELGMRRGREKPREELAWPRYTPPEPMEITTPQRPPWEHEQRFKGDK